MIYIAGKYTSQARLREHREALREMGYDCESSWLDEKATDANAGADLMISNAVRDIEEVKAADVLIIDTLDESATGGREVELGIALVTAQPSAPTIPYGPPTTTINLVGPKRNIFHHLAHFEYESWDEVLQRALTDAIELGT